MSAGTAEQAAIVGMAVLLPRANSLETYWTNLVDGVDAITDVPPNRWEPTFYDPADADRPDRVYCRRGGFIDEFKFDPVRFGIMPASVADIDVEQLIALRVAAAAIDDAGGRDRLPDADRVGVIVGRGGHITDTHVAYFQRVRLADQVCHLLREMLPDTAEQRLDLVRDKINKSFGSYQPEAAIGMVPNLTASRVANRLDLRGPAYTVDAACASSLVAVDHAVSALLGGRLDAVIVGGVHHTHDIMFWSLFSQLRALSRRGEIRPFDSAADGLLIGEGTGMVVLKRHSDAVRDGDTPYAVIRGTGMSSDGRTASLVNPAVSGQVLALRQAWAAAGLDPTAPHALGLLEAHGTATPAGDVAELATVADVFGPDRGGPRPVIGSVKSMIGHTMPAAGIAGLVKAVLAVSRGVLLPTLHCDNPRPELARTRFAPITAARSWDGPEPRRAAVNAFGFGGVNAHVIVEQVADRQPSRRPTATPVAPATRAVVHQPDQIVLLTGPDPETVARLLDSDDHPVRAAGTSWARDGRTPNGRCRLGIVDPTAKRLAIARQVMAAGSAWRGGRDIWFSPQPLLGDGAGRVAFVFPGLEASFAPRINDIATHFGLDTGGPPAAGLRGRMLDTVRVGMLLHRALGRIGVTPDAVAGHSIGEWTAGLAAGVVEESALHQVAALFEPGIESPDLLLMVIGASAATVTAQLADHPGVVLSLDNAPAQSVVCGPEAQVNRLVEAMRQQNVICQPLPFRAGFHTPYLQPVVDRIRAVAGPLPQRRAQVPIWSATLAAPSPTDASALYELFFQHLVQPVRFRSTVTAMYDAGIRVFLQAGPGHLASLVHESLHGRDHLAMPANVAHRSGLDQLRRVATAMWVEGGQPDLRALDARPAPAPAPSSAPAAMTVNLGGSRIRLGAGAAALLADPPPATVGRAAVPPDSTRPGSPPGVPGPPLTALHDLARQPGAAAELAALLHEAADSAVAVLAAAGRPADERVSTRRAADPGEASGPGATDGSGTHRTILHVSLATMPHLLDHCLFSQPADWPYPADRWPVVPATTIIHHMIDVVERVAPGRRAVRVADAHFTRWVIAEPALDIEIAVKPTGPDRFNVTFGSYARAYIETAVTYPTDPPPRWYHDPADERPARTSAERMYAGRIMFHGPAYRGITAVHAIGDRHVRGTVRTPAAPGGLLDTGLQLLGSWLHDTQSRRAVAFPVSVGTIQLYGPTPLENHTLECVGRITSVDEGHIVADVQLSTGDTVWAQLGDCVDRRFDSHPQSRPVELFPGRHAVSVRQPQGWTMVFDCWPDPSTQSLVAHQTLGSAGYRDYERQSIANRKRWLLGRLAVKDAVRFRMWDDGAADVFPIEIRVDNGADGRPRVHGWAGRAIPACTVSLAHTGEVGVAIAAPAADTPGVGIDVAEIADHPDSTLRFALTDSELALLDTLSANQGPDRAGWFTRFWAAKEATAKAEGTGLGGTPRRFTVVAATPTAIAVEVDGRTYQVQHRGVANPDGLPARQYVVAWTWGPDLPPPRGDRPRTRHPRHEPPRHEPPDTNHQRAEQPDEH